MSTFADALGLLGTDQTYATFRLCATSSPSLSGHRAAEGAVADNSDVWLPTAAEGTAVAEGKTGSIAGDDDPLLLVVVFASSFIRGSAAGADAALDVSLTDSVWLLDGAPKADEPDVAILTLA